MLGLVLLFNAAGCDAQLEPDSIDSTQVEASQPLAADTTPTLASVCGNGLVEAGEACDDNNTTGGDGCSATCTIEPGYSCHDAPSLCNPGCGDAALGEGEQCEDNNSTAGDGCSATCTVEPGYVCTGTPLSTCTVTCGDGVKAASEACDDGNKTNGDGCSSTCTIEAAHGCKNTGKSLFYSRLGRRDCTNVSNLNTPSLPATGALPVLSTPDRYRIRYVSGAVSYSGTNNWFPGIFGVNPTGGSTTGAFSLGYSPPGSSATRELAVSRAFSASLVKDFDAPSGEVRISLIDTDCALLNNTDTAVFYRVDAVSICQLIPVITTPAEGATSSGTISGTATPGSTVNIYVNGSTTPACTVTTAANGTWTCPVPGITETPQTIVARSTILSATEESAPRNFVGDITPPDTTIPVVPPKSGPGRTGRFEYASNDPTATFQCSLDGGDFVPCSAEYTVEPGPHTLRVRAVDPAGNVDPTPAEYTWTVVDDTAPDTTITQGPPSRGPGRTGRFEYASTESGSTFQCSLDGGAYAPCDPEYTVQPGNHTLRVRAVDPAGNVDPTPAEYTWTVVDDTRTLAGGGCSAVPGPSLVALLGLMFLRRRNRR